MTISDLLKKINSEEYREITSPEQRIQDSIQLARLAGVSEANILKSEEEAEKFFNG